MFHVGQKVAMIRGSTSYEKVFGCSGWPSCINARGIYTIRDVDTRGADFGWPIVLRFEEFFAEPWPVEGLGLWEPGFPGDCFRPIVEHKTDISIFTEMLTPAPVHVGAR